MLLHTHAIRAEHKKCKQFFCLGAALYTPPGLQPPSSSSMSVRPWFVFVMIPRFGSVPRVAANHQAIMLTATLTRANTKKNHSPTYPTTQHYTNTAQYGAQCRQAAGKKGCRILWIGARATPVCFQTEENRLTFSSGIQNAVSCIDRGARMRACKKTSNGWPVAHVRVASSAYHLR